MMQPVKLSILLCFVAVSYVFSQFSGGNGTQEEPYKIQNVEQLDSIRYFLDKSFELMNDLDFKGTRFCNSKNSGGWTPIGAEDRKFEGTLDGAGNKIKNLCSTYPLSSAGLFGYCGNARITNVSVENGSVEGRRLVGLLAGVNEGYIGNCNVSGTVQGSASVGGLIGYNYGYIEKCDANVEVSGDTAVGGLTGGNEKSIKNCRSSGTVSGTEETGGLVGHNGFKRDYSYSTDDRPRINDWESYIEECNSHCEVSSLKKNPTDSGRLPRFTGGLVGNNTNGIIYRCSAGGRVEGGEGVGGLVGFNDEGWLNQSFATGAISGDFNVGGLLGNNYGLVENCYATGDVHGAKTIGGLVGYCDNGWVINCLAIGKVDSCFGSGGLAGWEELSRGASSIRNCFWDRQSSGTDTSSGGKGLRSGDLKKIATFKNAGWDVSSVWCIQESANRGYPALQKIKTNPSTIKRRVVNVVTRENVQEVAASSTCKGKADYLTKNVIDHNEKTAWVEGKEGDGIGEWISFTFKQPLNIEELRIFNGYTKSEAVYTANNRVKRCKIEVVTDANEIMIDTLDLQDLTFDTLIEQCGQRIIKNKSENQFVIKKITLTILDVFKGSKYKDTCISEFIIIKSRWEL